MVTAGLQEKLPPVVAGQHGVDPTVGLECVAGTCETHRITSPTYHTVVPFSDSSATTVAAYSMSKGALRFPIDEPLPDELVEKLVTVRLRQLSVGGQ